MTARAFGCSLVVAFAVACGSSTPPPAEPEGPPVEPAGPAEAAPNPLDEIADSVGTLKSDIEGIVRSLEDPTSTEDQSSLQARVRAEVQRMSAQVGELRGQLEGLFSGEEGEPADVARRDGLLRDLDGVDESLAALRGEVLLEE